MVEAAKKIFKFFDVRDYFVLIGFLFLFIGIAGMWTPYMAMTAIGVIILIKGLTKWF
jgi:hypothetical protein